MSEDKGRSSDALDTNVGGSGTLSRSSNNNTLADNLASTFLRTPARPAPNSAQKRRPIPNLSRPIASPSHSTKISMIFSDAATATHGLGSPPRQRCPTTPNMKRTRLPLSQAKTTKFGHHQLDNMADIFTNETAYQDGQSPTRARMTPAPIGKPSVLELGDDEAQEPISSGFASPVTPCRKRRGEIREFVPLVAQRSQSLSTATIVSSDDDHHRVALPMPLHLTEMEATRAGIGAWLDDVLKVVDNGPNSVLEQADIFEDAVKDNYPEINTPELCLNTDLVPDSNKENRPPAGSLPRIQPPRTTDCPDLFQPGTPSRLPYPITRFSTKPALQTPKPFTPKRHLEQPPRREKACLDSPPRRPMDSPKTPLDFTIHEDELASALAKLSPSVETCRKGRHPRRERCASYWDNDILEPESLAVRSGGCIEDDEVIGRDCAKEGELHVKRGKVVLGESGDGEVLTREKPFVVEAEGMDFGFECRSGLRLSK